MTTYDNNIAKREQVAMPELFEINSGTTVERFTSYSMDLTFTGNVYTAAPIKRGSIKRDSTLGVQKVDVTAATSTQFRSHISATPIDPATVTIWRAVADDLTEYAKLFTGQVQSVSSKGISSTATCVGKNSILDAKFPGIIYQSNCNHFVYDEGCGILRDTFKVVGTLTGVSGTTYTSTTFGAYADHYFDFGWVRSGQSVRLVTNHVGNDLTLQLQFDSSVDVGDSIDVYPGCDGSWTVCNTKFSNTDNFLGMTTIPSKNPCIWGFK